MNFSQKFVHSAYIRGSMEHLTNDTIGGFNSFLKEQKKISGEAILTTVLFNNSYKLLHDRVNIKNVEPITAKDYVAEGNTALLDVMGKTINDIKLHNTIKNERPGKIIFLALDHYLLNILVTSFSKSLLR